MSAPTHWQQVYEQHSPDQVSWYEPHPELSLALIAQAGLPSAAAILDAGGGASRLAGELLQLGYTDITVADISATALGRAQAELGAAADQIQWVEADLQHHQFARRFDLWHDRAVLHFMVDATDRDAYLAAMRRALHPGGHLIVATFGPEGPTRCSGLPVRRYSAEQLARLLEADFELRSSHEKQHETPAGSTQHWVYAHLRKRA